MHDIAIVGGGLCGLALLRLLSGSGLDVVLFEARARLGGRVLSVPARGGHPGGDLGPGWYWPDTQPLLNGLITELGLRTFAQHDQGISLYVGGPDQPPASLGERPVHDGARRIDGGMGRIIEGLAHALPPARLQTGCSQAASSLACAAIQVGVSRIAARSSAGRAGSNASVSSISRGGSASTTCRARTVRPKAVSVKPSST